ncbi:hypothetical protein [Rhizobium sullae]|uniref:Uncharacterized protein n=1 Tax=Rhizobium sullae TaxID=50338 RepID=A0A4R3Q2Y4_RHISU|nr:hypothetical protein [Rhizobium sullae]TCU11665.1 hypothetical protein EV132_1175 [Rhizobium sullae]
MLDYTVCIMRNIAKQHYYIAKQHLYIALHKVVYLLLLTPFERLILFDGFRLQGFAEWERQSLVGTRMGNNGAPPTLPNRDTLTEAHVP